MTKTLISIISHRKMIKKSTLMYISEKLTDYFDVLVSYQDVNYYHENKDMWGNSVKVVYKNGLTQGDNRSNCIDYWKDYNFVVTIDDDFRFLKKVHKGNTVQKLPRGEERNEIILSNLVEFINQSIEKMNSEYVPVITAQPAYFQKDPGIVRYVQRDFRATALGVWKSEFAIKLFKEILKFNYPRIHGDDSILTEILVKYSIPHYEDNNFCKEFGFGKNDKSVSRPEDSFSMLTIYDAIWIEHFFPGMNNYYKTKSGNIVHSHRRKSTDKELADIIIEKINIPKFEGLEKFYEALMEDLKNDRRSIHI